MTGAKTANLFLITTVCLWAGAAPAHAQHPAESQGRIARAVARVSTEFVSQQPAFDTSWSDAMTPLTVGADVRATLEQGPPIRGIFVAADAESLTLWVHDTERRLMRGEIRRVELSKGTRRRRHERIGMIIGGVLGAAIMGRRCKGESLSSVCHEEAMLYFGGPMLAGGAIGHALPKGVSWRAIYVRRPGEK
jgi:hypothetical protein